MDSQTKVNIKCSYKYFSYFLKIELKIHFFLSPTEKDKLALIIYLFGSIKSIGSNNIPTKILELFKNGITTC